MLVKELSSISIFFRYQKVFLGLKTKHLNNTNLLTLELQMRKETHYTVRQENITLRRMRNLEKKKQATKRCVVHFLESFDQEIAFFLARASSKLGNFGAKGAFKIKVCQPKMDILK